MRHPVIHVPPVRITGVVGTFAHVRGGCVRHGFERILEDPKFEFRAKVESGLAVLLEFK